MNRSTGRLWAPLLTTLCIAGISRAQSLIPNQGHPSTPIDQSTSKSQPKNPKDAFDREAFSDAEQGYAQLIQKIDDAIKKIAVSTLPKNSFIEVDGVKKPATIQKRPNGTGTLDKVKRKKDAASLLRNVNDVQKQAMDLLTAGKYPGDLDTYRKSLRVLTENRAKLDDATFQFYSARSKNAQKESVTEYWRAKFRALRNKYPTAYIPKYLCKNGIVFSNDKISHPPYLSAPQSAIIVNYPDSDILKGV
jgi:hypothetical protein